MKITRRVQLTGNTTYIVSLPKDWAKLNNIKAGTEVYLNQEEDGGLKITSSLTLSTPKTTQITIDDKSPEEIRREFIANYLAGFASIKFTSSERIAFAFRKIIASEVNRLIGLEVVDESQNEILVQDFFSTENLSIEQTVKRAYAITMNMYQDLIEALEKNDAKIAQGVTDQDDEVDRVFFLVLRQIGIVLENASFLKKLSLKSTDCISYTRLITSIERTADNLAKQAAEAKTAPKTRKEITNLNKKALANYSLAVKACFSTDKKQANQLLEEIKALTRECEKMKADTTSHEVNLLDKIASISEHSAEIAEIAIDKQK